MRKLLAFTLIAGLACPALAEETPASANPIRHDTATALLLQNLRSIGKSDCFLFGQANALTLSYDGNPVAHPYNGTSDVKDLTGAHPAFVESDFMWYKNPQVKAYDMDAMREAYRQGLLCGYCWHMAGMYAETFNTSGDGVANNRLVKDILAQPDREQNKALDWFLTEYETKAIPVFQELGFPLVFRPLHEMTGNWFWWGSKIPPKETATSGALPPESPEATTLCTPEEYVQLYRLLVTHLRSRNIRNLLFVWAPDKSADMRYYPGDEYVDIIGYDGYDQGLMNYYTLARHTENLQALSDFAREHHKAFALTETGCLMDYPATNSDFWTKNVLGPLKENGRKSVGVAYVMTWYNADWNHDGKSHAFVPYLGIEKMPGGQAALSDFLLFRRDPSMLLADDIAPMKIYSATFPKEVKKNDRE
jgi:mannan endo-1,4-beta-mannosidase